MKKNKIILVALMSFALNFQTSAQSILNAKDLSSIHVELLTQSNIIQIQKDLKTRGITIEQFREEALSRGMTPSEFDKLKIRLSDNKLPHNLYNTQFPQDDKNNDFSSPGNSDSSVINKKIYKNLNPLIYGSELFNDMNIGYAENRNIATPLNYIIGPKDVLQLVIYGLQEFSTDLIVSNEGKVFIENVGQVNVGGLSIEVASLLLKQQLSKSVYPSLRTDQSKFSLTVVDMRTIQVSVIGAIKSGKYNVSSLSNVLSVLNQAGGPTEIGSFRNIELIRNNSVISKIDLYQFMQYGDQKQIMTLKDNDVIRIPPYKSRIEIKGHVKRPGYFETLPNETFRDILFYAGGFDDTAYTALIQVIQKTEKERAVKDLMTSEFDTYKPISGDIFYISKVLDRYQNRVKLTGAVFRPNNYELNAGMRILDLIKKGDGLREDAFLNGAQLIRQKSNVLKEVVKIDLNKVMYGDSIENILLLREDELYISSILDLKDSLAVSIYGEVHKPGKYQYHDSMTVKDIIILAGGTTYFANSQVEIARMYTPDKGEIDFNITAKILRTEFDENLNFTSGSVNYFLRPFDVISITKKYGYADNQIVTISGQVQFAGKYSLTSRVDRVSDILIRSGGLISNAYGKGAYIKRRSIIIDSVMQDDTPIDTLLSPEFNVKDNSTVQHIALDIEKILKHPGSYDDLILSDKDEIVIPKIDNKISVRGGVLRPVSIAYHEGITVNECISAAGGLNQYSKRSNAYVVYYNGRAKRTKQFGILRISPRLEPGCEVVLPESNAIKKDFATSLLQLLSFVIQMGTSIATLRLLTQ